MSSRYGDSVADSSIFSLIWTSWLLSARHAGSKTLHQQNPPVVSRFWPMQADLYKKVAHTRLPSIRFRSWSRFLAVSLQVMWVTNPVVGCHYFPPGLQLPPAILKRAATNFAAGWTQARWVWTVCLRLLPDSVATAIWIQALLCLSSAR